MTAAATRRGPARRSRHGARGAAAGCCAPQDPRPFCPRPAAGERPRAAPCAPEAPRRSLPCGRTSDGSAPGPARAPPCRARTRLPRAQARGALPARPRAARGHRAARGRPRPIPCGAPGLRGARGPAGRAGEAEPEGLTRDRGLTCPWAGGRAPGRPPVRGVLGARAQHPCKSRALGNVQSAPCFRSRSCFKRSYSVHSRPF